MKKKEITLGDVYGDMLKSVKTVVNENAQENINKSKKIPKMSKNAFNDKMDIQKGGPTSADGFHKALNDEYCGCDEEDNEEQQYDRVSQIEQKLKNPKLSDKERQSLEKILKEMKKDMQREEAEENIVKESKKIARNRLNTFMMKKSTFDKLFESVMGDSFEQDEADQVDALGLGDAPTDDEFEGDEGEGDEGGEITITLDRATAQKLHDIFMSALGDETTYGEEGDDLDFNVEDEDMDEEGMYDDEEEYDIEEEDEESTFPTDKVGNDGTVGPKNGKDGPHPLQGKGNKVKGRPQPKNQGTKVVGTTDKVGNDGDYGHALHGAKQPNMGKSNQVSDLRASEDYFR
jgi:hypothetical protein